MNVQKKTDHYSDEKISMLINAPYFYFEDLMIIENDDVYPKLSYFCNPYGEWLRKKRKKRRRKKPRC